MEEQINPIFDIIKNYHIEKLESHLAKSNAHDLLAINEQGIHPVEFALRRLIETPEPNRRNRLIGIVLMLLDAAGKTAVPRPGAGLLGRPDPAASCGGDRVHRGNPPMHCNRI